MIAIYRTALGSEERLGAAVVWAGGTAPEHGGDGVGVLL